MIKSAQFPRTTVIVWCATAIVTSAQLLSPAVTHTLQRDPHALAAGEWWRLVTPLLVHPEGRQQILFDFAALLVVGVLAERAWGTRRWLIVYFASGVAGEIAGYLWQPFSGGSSVGTAGLLGSLCSWLVMSPGLARAKVGGGLGLLAGLLLTMRHDIHGPPLLAGAGLAIIGLALDASSIRSPPRARAR